MGGWTKHCRIWTSAIFFLLKPSPNLFMIFDYNHQIMKESQDIENPKIGRSVYSNQPDRAYTGQQHFSDPAIQDNYIKTASPLYASLPHIHSFQWITLA